MKWINFNEIWGSEFQTAKCGKISIEVTPASVWALLLDSLETIQVGPLTPQNFRFCLSGASRAIVSQTRIFNPERITHIPCLKMRVSKTWLACFWQCQFGVRIPIPSGTGSQKLKIEGFIFSVILMCLIWYRDSYGFLHMAFLQFWKSKLASFLWHILSCVHCHELSCFAKQNPLYRNPLLCASVPKVKAEHPHRPWSCQMKPMESKNRPWAFKIFNRDLKILISWWCHDDGSMISKSEMPKIWSCQILRIKKSWSCQNLRTSKIWSCQKLRCTKNLIMSKSENPKNLIMSKMRIQDSEKKKRCWCHHEIMEHIFLLCLFPPRIPDGFLNFYKSVLLHFYVFSMSKIWGHHKSVHVKIWESRNLDHVKFWESRNPDHVKIWEHQKSDHVNIWESRNLDHVKSWESRNLDHVKIWESRNLDHVKFWESRNLDHVKFVKLLLCVSL